MEWNGQLLDFYYSKLTKPLGFSDAKPRDPGPKRGEKEDTPTCSGYCLQLATTTSREILPSVFLSINHKAKDMQAWKPSKAWRDECYPNCADAWFATVRPSTFFCRQSDKSKKNRRNF